MKRVQAATHSIALFACVGCGLIETATGPNTAAQADSLDRWLWESTIEPYLTDSLWSERDRADAGGVLMGPVRAAFQLDEPVWKAQFTDHFRRLMEAQGDPELHADNELSWLGYLYVASHFTALATEVGHEIPTGLPEFLCDIIHRFWREVPAWQWDTSPFAGGMRERIEWKLAQRETSPGFHRAIGDADLYLFAMAADLRFASASVGMALSCSTDLDEILETALRVLQDRGIATTGGGWLFQPGLWTDHPEYAYAGHAVITQDMEPRMRSGIAEDTSHSHRWPVWLRSLEAAYRAVGATAAAEYLGALINGLRVQFVGTVMVPPTADFRAYRTMNFMDGWNGVYRWQYVTLGTGVGIGPYELSGTLMLGWWVALGGEEVGTLYRDMSARFPLSPEVTRLYRDKTTRRRHPIVTEPFATTNGLYQLLSRLAAKIAP